MEHSVFVLSILTCICICDMPCVCICDMTCICICDNDDDGGGKIVVRDGAFSCLGLRKG